MAEPLWRLRRAAAEDADRLSLIANACFLDTYAASLDGADLVAHCLRSNGAATFAGWTSDAGSVVTVAETATGGPVGYSVLTGADFPIAAEDGDIELRRIYSLRQTYGTGLGAALMARAVADAQALGARRMLLGVWGQNFRARAFYERQGFRVIGSRPFKVGSEVHEDPIYARAV